MSESDGGERREYGRVVVVGGGCYGAYYVRQLERAVAAGALAIERLIVVDRDANCAVAGTLATSAAPPLVEVEMHVAEWSEFFNEYLSTASASPAEHSRDAIAPSPLMPHLMAEWLVQRARARGGARYVAVEPFDRLPEVPWERAGADATHYVSFATWTCPINCVEPRTCPHTRGPRSWSMPVALGEFAARERAGGRRVNAAVLHCRHRSYGVGMFDTSEVLGADALIGELIAAPEAADVVIGTVSHCHGALTRLVIGPRRAEVGSPNH